MSLLPRGLTLYRQSRDGSVNPLKSIARPTIQRLLSNLLRKTLVVLGVLLTIYCAIVVFLLTPWIQTRLVYAHRFLPGPSIHTGFVHPEDYGLAPGEAINFRIRETGPDATSLTLGAWFMFSTPFYRSLPFPQIRTESDDISLIKRAISESPTLLLFHGRTGDRSTDFRTSVYSSLTSRLSVNILTLDYRGFGDSEGQPSVSGVAMDARAAWDWLTLEMGAEPENVIIVGHSLGTAIASILAAELGREGVKVRGVALLAPFSSIRHLMDHILHVPTPIKPLSSFPFLSRWVTQMVAQAFDTLCEIPYITAPMLIAHATDDLIISSKHSEVLFNTILDPYLHRMFPTAVTSSLNGSTLRSNIAELTTLHHLHADWDVLRAAHAARAMYREKVVTRTEVPFFGVIQEFKEPSIDGTGRRVTFLETLHGGHGIMHVEGVQDVLGRMFGLISLDAHQCPLA